MSAAAPPSSAIDFHCRSTAVSLSPVSSPPKRIGRKPRVATCPDADEWTLACGRWVGAALDAAGLSGAELRRRHGVREAAIPEFRTASREPSLRQLVRIAAITGSDLGPLMASLSAIVRDQAGEQEGS